MRPMRFTLCAAMLAMGSGAHRLGEVIRPNALSYGLRGAYLAICHTQTVLKLALRGFCCWGLMAALAPAYAGKESSADKIEIAQAGQTPSQLPSHLPQPFAAPIIGERSEQASLYPDVNIVNSNSRSDAQEVPLVATRYGATNIRVISSPSALPVIGVASDESPQIVGVSVEISTTTSAVPLN